MNQVVVGINFAIAVSGLTICVLGLWQALHEPYLKLVTRKFLVAIFIVLVCYVALDLFGQVIDDFRGTPRATAQRIELAIESILPSLAGLPFGSPRANAVRSLRIWSRQSSGWCGR